MFIVPTILTPQGERPLHIGFGSPKDAAILKAWRVSDKHSNPIAAKDAVEFAQLGGKRWRYYARRGEVAKSLDDLIARTQKIMTNEVGFLLVAKPDWNAPTKMLAMAWCRRTWCHHLVLDFLACHPVAFDGESGYGGVGTAMLIALGLITARLDIPLLWGEATEISAGFYSKKALGGEQVLDHFFIKGKLLSNLQKEGLQYAL